MGSYAILKITFKKEIPEEQQENIAKILSKKFYLPMTLMHSHDDEIYLDGGYMGYAEPDNVQDYLRRKKIEIKDLRILWLCDLEDKNWDLTQTDYMKKEAKKKKSRK